MTRAELKTIYVEATIRARTKPQRSEEDLWAKEFEYVDFRDLKSAIDTHFGKSQWMPKEGELKPLIESAQRSRMARVFANTLLTRWQCPECKATCCDFIPPDDHRPRRCAGIPQKELYEEDEICGAPMAEIHRAPYTSKERKRAA